MRPFSYLPAAACCLLLAFSLSACSGAPARGSAPSPSPPAPGLAHQPPHSRQGPPGGAHTIHQQPPFAAESSPLLAANA